jgi:hypothetical protein
MVDTAPLFAGLHERLMDLLRRLEPEDWLRPTVAGSWRVRDVAAHLIDGQMRRLSLHRDGHAPAPDRDLSEYADLVDFLNELNASWVEAMQRVSTGLLLDMLDTAGRQLAEFVVDLNPRAPAPLAVAWAGEEASENWFDIGRDYTELWHHQAQIRLAVNAMPLDQERWLHPLLALSVRGVPRSLGGIRRTSGTEVVLCLEGEAGGTWSAVSGDIGWRLFQGRGATAAAEVVLPADEAWRVFFNAISAEEARALARCSGDPELCDAVLETRSVMV